MIPNPIPEQQRKAPQVGAGLLGVAPTIEIDDDGGITNAQNVTPLEGEHWVTGMTWLPEGCKLSDALALTENWARPASQTDAAQQYSTPFIVNVVDEGSAIDLSRDRVGRATRSLLAEQSYQIAREFEAGAIASAASGSHKTRYLDDGSLSTVGSAVGDDYSFGEALDCLDGALTGCLRNGQGMIHMTPTHLSAAQRLRWVRWNGNTPYSPHGHVIAADAGYTGAAHDATSLVFGTDMIRVVLGPIKVVGADPDDVTIDTNDRHVVAYRPAAYIWDGCCHLGVDTGIAPCV